MGINASEVFHPEKPVEIHSAPPEIIVSIKKRFIRSGHSFNRYPLLRNWFGFYLILNMLDSQIYKNNRKIINGYAKVKMLKINRVSYWFFP